MNKLLLGFATLLIVSCSKYPSDMAANSSAHSTPLGEISTIKNIRSLDDSAYEFAGFSVENKPAVEVTHYYSRGLTHTTGGKLAHRTLNLLTGTWSAPVIDISDSIHINGATGGMMDNNQTVLFFTKVHTNGTREIFITKVDTANNFSTPIAFNWGSILQLPGGFFFGPMVKGDACGEYYKTLYQVATGRYRISLIKTTDHWDTYFEAGVIYDGNIPFSETAAANLGGGKFVAITRINNSGGLATFESVNSGTTWLRRPSSNLYWWNGGGPSIPWIGGDGSNFTIPYECRDTWMIHISLNNTVTANFGNTSPTYTPPEIYAYHHGTGGNPSLGYVSVLKLSTGINLVTYYKEFNNRRANIQWTFDDFVTDPAGTPFSPALKISGISTTSFRYDITNYSDKDWENVRYLSMDLSTDSLFSTFVTAKYRSISAYPAVPINNIRVVGYWDTFNGLLPNTTYWLRLTAKNNTGSSAPTIVKIKTN